MEFHFYRWIKRDISGIRRIIVLMAFHGTFKRNQDSIIESKQYVGNFFLIFLRGRCVLDFSSLICFSLCLFGTLRCF